MRAVDIIEKKRDGLELSRDEIRFIVQGYTHGEVPNYQVSALLMAIFLRGMTIEETTSLTHEMLYSGVVVDLSFLGRPRVDKHSTGGVGDKTSLVIAPVVAGAGVPVPMISGRSLAHSGGTLDKLESIPGFNVNLTLDEYRAALEKVGCALIGQTQEIAPADKKLYALRDVTATVPCQPLAAGSIMSKKLAEGITGLVLDVKTGSGAFMKTEAEAISLARLMIDLAKGMEKDAVALITDMNQPLGRMVGNSLEVIEAFETLKGEGPDDFNILCRELSAEMLVLGQATTDLESARFIYDETIASGKALNKMREIIVTQHGNPEAVDDYGLLPQANHQRPVQATGSGFVQEIDTRAIGHAAMLLGAGRLRMDTEIDLGVGLRVDAKIGDEVSANSSLVTVHYNNETHIEEVVSLIRKAYKIGEHQVEAPALIKMVLR